MTEEAVQIPCGGISLEGRLIHSAGATAGIVVCHPHPQYGGDMNSHVVTSICRAATDAGFATLRFNFRGTGGSGGRHAGGQSEPEDVRAAVGFLLADTGLAPGRIGLAGYSFGARMALLAGPDDDRVAALAAVSPPLGMPPRQSFEAIRKPLLLIAGTADPYVEADDLRTLADRCPESIEVHLVPDEDHFWWASVGVAADQVTAFFQRNLQ